MTIHKTKVGRMLNSIKLIFPLPVQKSIDFAAKMIVNFYRSEGFMAVNSLSFSFLLSFIPFALAIASISYWSPISTKIINSSVNYVFVHFLPQTGGVLYKQFKVFLHHTAHLPWFGFIFLVITAYNLIMSVETHLNKMLHILRPRKFIFSLALYTLFIILGALIVYAEVYLRVFLLSVSYLTNFEQYVIIGLNFILSSALFCCIYYFVPGQHARYSSVLITGMVASILFSLSKAAFVFYATHFFQSYDLIYGSLLIIPLFLLWLYIAVLDLLFCAQIMYVRDFQKFYLPQNQSE